MSNYAAERSTPSVPACGRTHLQMSFNGGTLKLNAHPGKIYGAVSGRITPKGFIYSVERQRESEVGPIHEGEYWIRPSQIWANHWYSAAPTFAWGNHRITIPHSQALRLTAEAASLSRWEHARERWMHRLMDTYG